MKRINAAVTDEAHNALVEYKKKHQCPNLEHALDSVLLRINEVENTSGGTSQF